MPELRKLVPAYAYAPWSGLPLPLVGGFSVSMRYADYLPVEKPELDVRSSRRSFPWRRSDVCSDTACRLQPVL